MSGVEGNGGETVYDLCLRYVSLRRPSLRDNSVKGWESILASIIGPSEMGGLDFRDVRAPLARSFFCDLRDRGYSYSYLKCIQVLLHEAFDMAVEDGEVRMNPFQFQMSKLAKSTRKPRAALPPEYQRSFLEFLRDDSRTRNLFDGMFVLFSSGLRISELCGLCVEDVDFTAGVIHVRRQLLRLKGGMTTKPGALHINPPKSASGLRDVPMLPGVREHLADAMLLNAGPPTPVWSIDHTEVAQDFVFRDCRGRPTTASWWQSRLKRACDLYNALHSEDPLPIDITPHVCRHTFATNMAMSGCMPKQLQVILGHSNITTTLNIYTHYDAESIAAEVRRVTKNNPRFAVL